MIEFLGEHFLATYSLILEMQRKLETAAKEHGWRSDVPEQDRQYLVHLVKEAQDACVGIGTEEGAVNAADAEWHLRYSVSYELVLHMLGGVAESMSAGLGKQKFAVVHPERHKYFQAENPFGLSQPTPFPSMIEDITAAGNAYALGLPTAAIYYLMRVAESGMRLLAKHLKVRLPRKVGAVEWAEWRQVIEAMDKKVDIIASRGGSKAKKGADREFYRGLLAELEGFKDEFRNNVMHVRKSYTDHDAASAIERVGAFVRRLGTRIHE